MAFPFNSCLGDLQRLDSAPSPASRTRLTITRLRPRRLPPRRRPHGLLRPRHPRLWHRRRQDRQVRDPGLLCNGCGEDANAKCCRYIGVAPEAKIRSYKVFGCGDGTVGLDGFCRRGDADGDRRTRPSSMLSCRRMRMAWTSSLPRLEDPEGRLHPARSAAQA